MRFQEHRRDLLIVLMSDAGADLIHGHSSHHAKAIEVYEDRLIMYGCGDFLTDYEGITGYEQFRGDLSVMYLPRLEALSGRLLGLKMIVLRARCFRLNRASISDTRWLWNLLNNVCAAFGTCVELEEGGAQQLHW
jgi:poly-gamma-glutamate capsule biosynthesis protein CapA/YwtB (metallophosphatase superfamily)